MIIFQNQNELSGTIAALPLYTRATVICKIYKLWPTDLYIIESIILFFIRVFMAKNETVIWDLSSRYFYYNVRIKNRRRCSVSKSVLGYIIFIEF